MLLGATAAVLIAASACSPASETPDLGDPSEYADELLEATNEAREEEGLAALAPSDCAREVALNRAADREEAGNLEHAPLDDAFEACPEFDRTAENLVNSAATPEEVVDAWMNSSGHRANILDAKLVEIGIGCVVSDAGLLCSQVFLGHDA